MPQIAIFTSHYGTAGATGGGRNEEEFIKEYTGILEDYLHKNGGFTVYRYGLTEHEMDIDDEWINDSYDLALSHHMDGSTNPDARGGSMLYCQNSGLVKRLGDAFGKRLTPAVGVPWRGNIERCDLDMTIGDNDNVPRGLLEIGFITNNADRDAIGYNMHKVAKAEVQAICEVFGVKYTLDGDNGGGEVKPPTPSGNWKDGLKGSTINGEYIKDAYDEKGWYHVTNKVDNPIYHNIQDATADKNHFATITNGESVEYKGVILGDKFNYIIYDRDNGGEGVIAITDRNAKRDIGYAE